MYLPCACRFMLDLKPEQMQEYMKKITSMAVSAGCKVCGENSRKTKR